MSDGTIKVPTWALPLLIGVLTVATSWGVLTANTAHASDERERIEKVAEAAVKKAQQNNTAIAITDQKVQAVIDSLARQEKIQEKSAAQLQMLLEKMLSVN
tara:strand:+ start:967 stop:1269 length:303 start_codon:yes stop_codon:yes gene_type:complete